VGLIRSNGSSFCDCRDVNCHLRLPTGIQTKKTTFQHLPATDDDVCTFRFTGSKQVTQDWYHCNTCNMKGSTGTCAVCAAVCHKGHDVVLHTHLPKNGFYCDCGGGGKNCIALKPRASLQTLVRNFEIILINHQIEQLDNTKLPDERSLCIICLERPRSIVLLPCKHLVCCQLCSPSLKGKCPLDRQQIEQSIEIYNA
jgi:hypothetical protein